MDRTLQPFNGVPFRISSHSQSDCVAVAADPGVVAVADTKTGHTGVLTVAPAAWRLFLGTLDR